MKNIEYLKTLDAESMAELIFPAMGDDSDSCQVFLQGTDEECEGNCTACMADWLNRERVEQNG